MVGTVVGATVVGATVVGAAVVVDAGATVTAAVRRGHRGRDPEVGQRAGSRDLDLTGAGEHGVEQRVLADGHQREAVPGRSADTDTQTTRSVAAAPAPWRTRAGHEARAASAAAA